MKPLYRFFYTILNILSRLLYRHRVYRPKKPYKGGAIIAPNHASHMDPPFVGCSWPQGIHYMGRSTLWDNPRLGRLISRVNCHPVNREGADPASLKLIISLLKSGEKVMVFPEGRRTDDGNLQPGQPGVAMLAIRAGCPVIPVYIHGTYEVWNRYQKKPKWHGKTACVFGEPIDPAEFADLPSRERRAALTERTMEEIAALRDWYLAGHKGPLPSLRPR